MKQALTSAGLLALGAASLYALDPEMSRQQSGRPFTVAATVRGFYDDNINTSPDRIIVDGRRIDPREESFGVQVSPSVHLNLPFDQTFIGLGYVYSLTWYDNRPHSDIDQSHEFSAKLRHQFNSRFQIGVDDAFVITSEPTVAERFGIITAPVRTRTRSDVMHNYGAIEGNIGLTRLLSLSLGYANHWYDYEADDAPGSRSALLDRLEHLLRADLRYQVNPKLVGVVGYNYSWTSFTGDEPIIAEGDNPDTTAREDLLMSDDRNSRSHYGYVGVDYDLTAKLRTTVRVGAQFSEYPGLDESSANPYADVSLSYSIRSGTSVEVGVRHMRNATDIAAVDRGGRPTLDAETTAIYGQFEHRIMRNLTGSLIGQFQHSTFNDGANDGDTEDLWLLGANLTYSFNRHFSAEIGYSYDQLDSHLSEGDRSYERNRVYIGVTARY